MLFKSVSAASGMTLLVCARDLVLPPPPLHLILGDFLLISTTLFLHTIAGRDFDPVDSTITLTTEDLVGILWTGHQYFPVEISLTEDDYIEPIQTFTLTLKVQSALDVEEGITSATFTITDKRSDSKCMFSKRG